MWEINFVSSTDKTLSFEWAIAKTGAGRLFEDWYSRKIGPGQTASADPRYYSKSSTPPEIRVKNLTSSTDNASQDPGQEPGQGQGSTSGAQGGGWLGNKPPANAKPQSGSGDKWPEADDISKFDGRWSFEGEDEIAGYSPSGKFNGKKWKENKKFTFEIDTSAGTITFNTFSSSGKGGGGRVNVVKGNPIRYTLISRSRDQIEFSIPGFLNVDDTSNPAHGMRGVVSYKIWFPTKDKNRVRYKERAISEDAVQQEGSGHGNRMGKMNEADIQNLSAKERVKQRLLNRTEE